MKPVASSLPRACAQCPWRIANQGTRHPHGFFTASNLRRLWTGLRTGRAPGMTCHPTDSRMADFEGYEALAERDEAFECKGSIVLLAREVMRFQAICWDLQREAEAGVTHHRTFEALIRYRAEAPLGLTRDGLAAVAARFLFGGSLARSISVDADALNDPEVGYPKLPTWDPAILERSQRPPTKGSE